MDYTIISFIHNIQCICAENTIKSEQTLSIDIDANTTLSPNMLFTSQKLFCCQTNSYENAGK